MPLWVFLCIMHGGGAKIQTSNLRVKISFINNLILVKERFKLSFNLLVNDS